MAEGGDEIHYSPLKCGGLAAGTGFQRPYYYSPNPVKLASSALEVMTDLKFVPAATVLGEADIEAASQLMIARGVRLLLVIDSSRDVVGLITARDLLGDRPAEVMRERQLQHDEVLVKDVMTRRDDIEVLELGEVLHARVGDIVTTLRGSGRQHALVVDHEAITGKTLIRGIFSASQIARQLGIPTNTGELSRTFAELDALLARR